MGNPVVCLPKVFITTILRVLAIILIFKVKESLKDIAQIVQTKDTTRVWVKFLEKWPILVLSHCILILMKSIPTKKTSCKLDLAKYNTSSTTFPEREKAVPNMPNNLI